MENRICEHEINYLAEEISKLNVESTAWLLAVWSKMQETRNDFKTKLLSKNIKIKKAELQKKFGRFSACPYYKKQKACWEENTENAADDYLIKKLVCLGTIDLINHQKKKKIQEY